MKKTSSSSARVPALAAMILCCLGTTGPASAASNVRYALVVGNNSGRGAETELPDLKHAERDAERIRDHLVRYGSFDADRVILIAGAGRAEIMEAARQLAEIHRRDRARLGPVPTLFTLFYTGHGLSARLLTRDDPLTAADLAAIFREVGADLNIGFFDACFAESMSRLHEKGAIATPGFNPVTELPEEVLDAEGTMLLPSSRPDEASFEDDRLGGLLTHYFLESFTEAPRDGVGVTLEQMWDYASRKTTERAAAFGRSQTPVKIVKHLKSERPLYFSFPAARDARLRFGPSVAGTFLIRYGDAALVETVSKASGQVLDVPVYPGPLSLSLAGEAEGQPRQTFDVAPGAEVFVRADTLVAARALPGYREQRIRSKGAIPGLVVTETREQPTVSLAVGYTLAPVPEAVLGAQHRFSAGATLALGAFTVDLGTAFGARSVVYPAWRYELRQIDLRLRGGWGLRFGDGRLDLEAGGGPTWLGVDYLGGGARSEWGAWLGAGARATWPLPMLDPLAVHLRASLGASWGPRPARDSGGGVWAFEPAFELGVTMPVWGP